MPNAKVLEEKKAVVASLVEKIKNSPAGVLVDYKGINVEDDTKLRKQLREAGVEYAVIKNTLIRFAAKELGFDWDENLHGTTALAISTTDDVVAPAKIRADFAKTHENFNLKAGYLEGKVIGEDEVKQLCRARKSLSLRFCTASTSPLCSLLLLAMLSLRRQRVMRR